MKLSDIVQKQGIEKSEQKPTAPASSAPRRRYFWDEEENQQEASKEALKAQSSTVAIEAQKVEPIISRSRAKVDTQLEPKPEPSSSCSSSSSLNLNNTTTTEEPLWLNIPEQLKGQIPVNQLRAMVRAGTIDHDTLEDSLWGFAHDLEKGLVKSKTNNPTAVFIGAIKNGGYISQQYLSQKQAGIFLTKLEVYPTD